MNYIDAQGLDFLECAPCAPLYHDELLISGFIRYCVRNFENYQSFLSRLSGNRKFRIYPILSSAVKFAEDLGFGNRADIITSSTLYNAFALFLPQKSGEQLYQAILNGQSALVSTLSLLSSTQYSINNKINSCPLCARNDVIECGVSYWHTHHQFPLIDCCPVHGIKLNTTLSDIKGRPVLQELIPTAILNEEPSCDQHVAIFASSLLRLAQFKKRKHSAWKIYRHHLKKRGLLTSGGSIRRMALKKELKQSSAEHKLLTYLLHNRPNMIYNLCNSALSEKQHIICHIVFGSWLLVDAGHYFQDLGNMIHSRALKTEREDPNHLLSLYHSGNSIRSLSKLTGRSRCYIRRQLTIANNGQPINPTKLSDQGRMAILELAHSGDTISAISKNLKLKDHVVENVISTTLDLVKHRSNLRQQQKRETYRNIIEEAVLINPETSIQEIKENYNTEVDPIC